MPNISVAEILKLHGKWIQSSEFSALIARKLNLSERQAYNLLKAAWRGKEIVKVELPDRTVIYGLSEFGPFGNLHFSKSSTRKLNFSDAFLFECFKNLERISNENVEGNPLTAYDHLIHLKAMLPLPLKEKLAPYFKKAAFELDTVRGIDIYSTQLKKRRVAYGQVCYLVDKISTLLHEQVEHDEKAG